ncbi:7-cyano-7-deazaguanine synthase QueC [Halobaculum magnesiiphilum]|uniref:7-cyano-7-deazaguanine synthase n=1 Tax=Halobaculum magnesiiphilum TaxID=1017351 RepID=A0A8T8WDU8_9EURY|nr:7-cyano-7-deazaguanine synthase QueC [Halobaculum magnesiiphilum]QZP38029.1 7-cyano-7-deazaguanine synthase QueC [Halobaculum magnesiiphilum]
MTDTEPTDTTDSVDRTDTEASTADRSDRSDRPGAVVLVSGGMDSATTAYEARERGYDLHFLHTSYGQNTETKERECAEALRDELGVPTDRFLHIETDHLARIGASSLTDASMAVEDADMDGEGDEIPSSYVPFRNANLLSMAVSYAEANDCEAVFVGAHSEDYSGYPDCRPEFFEAFERMVDVGTKPETTIDIVVPFVEDSKTDIAERGTELGVPYDLTWSCYREEAPACGTCDACAFRLQAFQRLGIEDPIEYEERPDYTGDEDPTAGV